MEILPHEWQQMVEDTCDGSDAPLPPNTISRLHPKKPVPEDATSFVFTRAYQKTVHRSGNTYNLKTRDVMEAVYDKVTNVATEQPTVAKDEGSSTTITVWTHDGEVCGYTKDPESPWPSATADRRPLRECYALTDMLGPEIETFFFSSTAGNMGESRKFARTGHGGLVLKEARKIGVVGADSASTVSGHVEFTCCSEDGVFLEPETIACSTTYTGEERAYTAYCGCVKRQKDGKLDVNESPEERRSTCFDRTFGTVGGRNFHCAKMRREICRDRSPVTVLCFGRSDGSLHCAAHNDGTDDRWTESRVSFYGFSQSPVLKTIPPATFSKVFGSLQWQLLSMVIMQTSELQRSGTDIMDEYSNMVRSLKRIDERRDDERDNPRKRRKVARVIDCLFDKQ